MSFCCIMSFCLAIYYIPGAWLSYESFQQLMDILIWVINHMQQFPCYPQEFLSAAQKRPQTSVCGCHPTSLQGRFVAMVTQCAALCTAKSAWIQCSLALAYVTIHNTSVLIHTPKPKNILSFCITSKLSGWKSYVPKHHQSCLPHETKCWESQHESKTAFEISTLGGYFKHPTMWGRIFKLPLLQQFEKRSCVWCQTLTSLITAGVCWYPASVVWISQPIHCQPTVPLETFSTFTIGRQ